MLGLRRVGMAFGAMPRPVRFLTPGGHHVTMVKKVLKDGSPCRKCGEVLGKMEKAGQMQYIDQLLVADERVEDSEGMLLAKKHEVAHAPFWVVDKDPLPSVYTLYYKFVKEELRSSVSKEEEKKERIKAGSHSPADSI